MNTPKRHSKLKASGNMKKIKKRKAKIFHRKNLVKTQNKIQADPKINNSADMSNVLPAACPALLAKNILDSTKLIELTRPVEIVSPEGRASEIIKLLKKGTPVFVSRKSEIIGIITKPSFLKNIINGNFNVLTAGELMEPIIAIDLEKNLTEAISLMNLKSREVLAVINKKDVLGIITSEKILDFLEKKLSSEVYSQDEVIETKIDEFIELLRKGPISISEARKKLNASEEQIEEWIMVLENQKIMRIEKHFGNLVVKNERKI